MKNIELLFHLLLIVPLGLLLSCDLTNDLDNISPPHKLLYDKAIDSESSAEQALATIYGNLRSQLSLSHIPAYLGITGYPELLPGTALGKYGNISRLVRNIPSTTQARMEVQTYIGLYNMIAHCNFVIDRVPKLKKSSFERYQRQKEIIAEAKGLRALGHFYLLRLWGQFYKMDSQYGIVLKTQSQQSNKTLPRSTVAQSYEAIMTDINYAIDHAPKIDYHKAKYYVNKTFLLGLKSKVLLYQGKYAEAAQLSQRVIKKSPQQFALLPTFNKIFDFSSKDFFKNKEALFLVYSDGKNPRESINSANWGRMIQVSKEYTQIAHHKTVSIGGKKIFYDNARVKFLSPPKNMKYSYDSSHPYETIYHLRMAEVYLIYAEAEARSKGKVTTEALNALNAVRKRVVDTVDKSDPKNPKTIRHTLTPYPQVNDVNQFLELVRIEKMMELVGEMGEHWYDLIRYDYADGFGKGFKVSDVKTSASDPDKFILPIPLKSVLAGNRIVIQNPSY